MMPNKGEKIAPEEHLSKEMPPFSLSIIAPVVAIVLLSLRPLFDVNIDPIIALPIGGVVGTIAMGKANLLRRATLLGLEKMTPVAILLIGTGCIAGIIKNSTFKDYLLDFLSFANIDPQFISPISASLMSAATASTTAGATIASASFSDIILSSGISAIASAAMINAGSTTLDHLPHGSFFHATAGAARVTITERFKLIPYETLIGFILTFFSVLTYLLFG